jgi:hypothetical protein
VDTVLILAIALDLIATGFSFGFIIGLLLDDGSGRLRRSDWWRAVRVAALWPAYWLLVAIIRWAPASKTGWVVPVAAFLFDGQTRR